MCVMGAIANSRPELEASTRYLILKVRYAPRELGCKLVQGLGESNDVLVAVRVYCNAPV
jgi:hypothetical protein